MTFKNLDAKLGAEARELQGFGQIVFQRILLIDAEGVAIRHGKIIRHARPRLARLGARRIGFERHGVEGAQAHAKIDLVAVSADAFDDLAQDAGAIGEGASVRAGPGESAQKFVQQIAVAMFDIDKIRPHLPGDSGRPHIIAD